MRYNNAYHAVLEEVHSDLTLSCVDHITYWSRGRTAIKLEREGPIALLNGSYLLDLLPARTTLAALAYYSVREDLAHDLLS